MSTPETSLPQGETSTPHLSEGARVINTFVAPTQTFEDIRHNQSWWVPWVILSIFSLAFSVTMMKKIGWDQIMENEIAKSPARAAQMEKMPPEQRERMLAIQAKTSEYIAYGYPVVILLVACVTALGLMATFNFGFGTQFSFQKTLAIVFYSWLPTIFTALLGVITIFVGLDPEGFNVRNPVATNPAYFMNPNEHKFLYGMLTMVDVIAIWIIFLMAIGFSSNSKVKRGTAFITIFALYFLVKLIGSGITAMF